MLPHSSVSSAISCADELAIFAVARAAGDGLRKSFDRWLDIGRAVQVARQHADAKGGGTKTRGPRFHSILRDQKLDWAARGSEAARLRQIMSRLDEVQAWRASLSDYHRARWSSPQSVVNRCPVFHSDGRTKGPTMKARPMSMRELLRLPADDAGFDDLPTIADQNVRAVECYAKAGRGRRNEAAIRLGKSQGRRRCAGWRGRGLRWVNDRSPPDKSTDKSGARVRGVCPQVRPNPLAPVAVKVKTY